MQVPSRGLLAFVLSLFGCFSCISVVPARDISLNIGATTITTGQMNGAGISLQHNLVSYSHGRIAETTTSTADLIPGVLGSEAATNRRPTLMNETITTEVGTTTNLQLAAVDEDGDPIVYSLPSQSTIVTLDPLTGSLTIRPEPDFSGTIPINVTVGDGWGTTTGVITVVVGDTAPAIDLINDNENITWAADSGASFIAGDIQLNAPVDTDFSGGTIVISINNPSPDDQLVIQASHMHCSRIAGIAVTGNEVSYNGITFATWSGGTNGTDLAINLTTGATSEAIEALLRQISYSQPASDPVLGQRTIAIQLTDAQGAITAEVQTTVELSTETTPPTNSAPEASSLVTATVAGLTTSSMWTPMIQMMTI